MFALGKAGIVALAVTAGIAFGLGLDAQRRDRGLSAPVVATAAAIGELAMLLVATIGLSDLATPSRVAEAPRASRPSSRRLARSARPRGAFEHALYDAAQRSGALAMDDANGREAGSCAAYRYSSTTSAHSFGRNVWRSSASVSGGEASSSSEPSFSSSSLIAA